MSLRINDHPILGPDDRTEKINIKIDGQNVSAYTGEPIAAALWAAGYKKLRVTKVKKEPRGIFCAIGLCTDCAMTVNGVANVRACITPAEEGMVVETQEGVGIWKGDGIEK